MHQRLIKCFPWCWYTSVRIFWLDLSCVCVLTEKSVSVLGACVSECCVCVCVCVCVRACMCGGLCVCERESIGFWNIQYESLEYVPPPIEKGYGLIWVNSVSVHCPFILQMKKKKCIAHKTGERKMQKQQKTNLYIFIFYFRSKCRNKQASSS